MCVETLISFWCLVLVSRFFQKLELDPFPFCRDCFTSYTPVVGFYLVDPHTSRELVLGPFAGEPTEHTRIAFGEGICGQAADTGKLFLIQDVMKETNYLSCSPNVRSEMVVPIFIGQKIVGELDIDSHKLHPFTKADSDLLEHVCRLVGPLLA